MGRWGVGSREGLMFNAVAKIPMQAFILFIGAMVFVFYIYQKPHILFGQNEMRRLESPVFREEYQGIAQRYEAAFERRRTVADRMVMANRGTNIRLIQKARTEYTQAQVDFDAARCEGGALAEKAGGNKVNDTNYIFLTFV